ncbi:hypothetical protein HUW51_08135 [Adhaeribacter swui]|uniref:DUF4348 domain-containing protein n=1 Tax=Adhaeribacter swui TaxID=2086471 RepID=A0A7G7G6B5_9BACT|nr:hypothetical protein [Adhaeribacter swui]QNF32699.1 hypothetical protein HUW51_08135 [Adhaeribacter swui]
MRLITFIWLFLFISCNNSHKESHNGQLPTTTSPLTKGHALTSIPTYNPVNENNFDIFLKKFSDDSTFQYSRIKFPIKVIYSVDDKDSITFIDRNKWEYTNYLNLTPSRIDKENLNNNLINLIYTIEDTGTLVYHFFQKKNGKWELILIEDHST